MSISLAFALPQTGFAQKKLKLQLKWYHQFQFAGFYAAQKQGYYKQEGLDVNIQEGTPQHPPVQTVLSGEADFGVTGPDVLTAFLNKKPVVVTAVIFQHSADVILSLSKNNIRTPSDLVGKNIMASNEHGFHLLRSIFLREGIPLDSIHFIDHSWKNDDLINGKADAITAYSTVEPQQLRAKGYECNIIKPIDYGIDFYGDLIFTTTIHLQENRAEVDAFDRASIKGWVYAMQHVQEMADYILTIPGVKERGITKAFLLEEAREMQKLILPDLIEIGHINAGRWQSMLAIYKELHVAKRDANINGLIYEPENDKESIFPILIYAVAIASVVSLAVLLWNWQLHRQVLVKTTALRSENAQRFEAEQRLELAIEAASLGIWHWDLANGEMSFNERWASILGYSTELVPKTMHESRLLIHPEDKAKLDDAAKDLITGGVNSNSLSYRLKAGNGSWKWLLSFNRVVSRDSNNIAERITGIHVDIDSLKSRENELNEISKELVKKNKELEKFAYITSHNLRAPVVNLKSLTDIYTEGELDEQSAADIFLKIKQSVTRLDSTLNDLIEIVSSKGGETINLETLHLETELKQVMASIEKQIIESGASISYNFEEAGTVQFSRRYLHSVLINLLTNAIKYRSHNRPLQIGIKAYPHSGFIYLQFTDNGIGIDLERFKNKIFGLYQRFNHDRDGKGLGLYIVKSQLEAMDGKIKVESVPDEGTTFKVMFYNPPA